MILSRPVNARATRTALIAASVPELTKRTRSIDGISARTRSPSSILERARRAEARAAPAAPAIALHEACRRVAVDQRAPRHHVVDEAVAVDVLDRRRRTRGG